MVSRSAFVAVVLTGLLGVSWASASPSESPTANPTANPTATPTTATPTTTRTAQPTTTAAGVCAAIIADSARCDQTLSMRLSTGAMPLSGPISLNEPALLGGLLTALQTQDPIILGQWATWRKAGNFELCLQQPDAHHCILTLTGGPEMGMCLPSRCSPLDYLALVNCQALAVQQTTNSTVNTLQNLLNTSQATIKKITDDPTNPLNKLLENLGVDLQTLPGLLANISSAVDLLGAAVGLEVGIISVLTASSTSSCSDQAITTLPPRAKGSLIFLFVCVGVIAVATLLNTARNWLWPSEGKPKGAMNIVYQLCAVENTRRLFKTRPSTNMDCLNGIRVISTGYVILGHSGLVYLGLASNVVPGVTDYLKTWGYSILINAQFAVDTFFWLAGFLSAYFILISFAKRAATGPAILIAYLHRFLRLTPVYAVVLLFWVNIAPYMSNGPLWERFQNGDQFAYCDKWWWTNMLYVSNVVGVEANLGAQSCMGWSWYLSNDMQFFVISIPALALYHRGATMKKLVIGFFVACIFVCCLIRGIRTSEFDLAIGDQKIYGYPFTRIAPYAVGVLFGMWWYEQKAMEKKAEGEEAEGHLSPSGHRFSSTSEPPLARGPTLTNWALWTASLVLGIFITSIQYNYTSGNAVWNLPTRWAYNCFGRFAWGVALCGIVHCLMTYPSIWSSMLSHKAWEVMAKLSYGAYLWHLLVIEVRYDASSWMHFSGANLTYAFFTNMILGYLCSYVSFVVIEKPCTNLEGMMMSSLMGSKPKKPAKELLLEHSRKRSVQ